MTAFTLTTQNVLFIIAVITAIFGLYNYFRNPQIKTDQEGIKLYDRISNLEKSVVEIREKHLTSVETDLKLLNTAINDLSKTVVRLSTIIDERIPKANAPQK